MAWDVPPGSPEEPEAPGAGKENIRDTVSITMDELPPVCIDQKVLLTCNKKYDPRDVLSYQWYVVNEDGSRTPINKATNRELWVAPTTTTTYQLEIRYILRDQEKVRNGNFELGNTGFTTEYRYTSAIGQTVLHPAGMYVIGTNPNNYHGIFLPIGDHTTGHGKMMICNGDPSRNRVVWATEIQGLMPGEQYAFSAWGTMVGDINPPILDFSYNGVAMGEKLTPKVPGGTWEQFYSIWTATSNTAKITLIDQNRSESGNDFAVDDISFAPVKLGVGSVTVRVLPRTDLQKIGDQEVCEEGDLLVKVNAIGSNITKYEWIRKKDHVLVGTASELKITDAEIGRDDGMYRCTVTGICGSKSDSIIVNVREKVRNRGVKVDSVSVCKNQAAELNAAGVSGYGLQYTWRFSANNWQGKGNGWLPSLGDAVTYRKASVGMADAGMYRCVVKGQCGRDTVYSVLNVEDKPSLKNVSPDTTVCVGAGVKLFVHPLTENTVVTWTLPDNTIVNGEYLDVVGEKEPRIYQYRLEKCGAVLSKGVLVKSFQLIQNLTSGRDTAVCEGGTASLWMKAQGVGLRYRWSRRNLDGTVSVVNDSSQLTLKRVGETEVGEYVGTVTDTCGNFSETRVVKVSLLKEYEDLQITADRECCPNEAVTLEVTGGKNGLKYEWTTPVGAKVNGSVLSIRAMSGENAGKYVCRVTGVCQGVEKEVVLGLKQKLEVMPSIYSFQPCEGEDITLRAEAKGGNVAYHWTREGADWGTNSSVQMLKRVALDDAGLYECHLTSDCGDTVLVYRVGVKESTRIINRSPDRYVAETDRGSLFVSARGVDNHYEWRQNGELVGSNSNVLELPSFVGKPEGDYQFICDVIGNCGRDRATINVYLRELTDVVKDTTIVVCKNENYMFRVLPRFSNCPTVRDTTYWVEHGGMVYSEGNVMSFPAGTEGGIYEWHIKNQCEELIVKMNIVVEDVPRLDRIVCNEAFQVRNDTLMVCEGGNIRLVAQATHGKRFEWLKQGTVIQTGTDSWFAMNGVSVDMAGTYVCRVVNDCGEATKGVVLVVEKKAGIISSDQEGKEVCHGGAVRLKVEANVSNAVFTWSGPNRENWKEERIGKVSYYQNIFVRSEKDNGIYSCRVENVCGAGNMNFNVVVKRKLELTGRTRGDTVCEGEEVTLRVDAVGQNVAYRWMKGNLSLNSISNEYVVKGVVPSNVGQYECHIHSDCGDTVLVYQVGMKQPTRIVDHSPVHIYMAETDKGKLFVSASGENNHYLWKQDGEVVGDNSNVLNLPSFIGKPEGNYQFTCEVTGDCGKDETTINVHLRQFTYVAKDTTISVCKESGYTFKVNSPLAPCPGGENSTVYQVVHNGVVCSESDALPFPAGTEGGVYVWHIKNQCGEANVMMNVLVNDVPILERIIGEGMLEMRKDTLVVCEGSEVKLFAKTVGGYLFEWSRQGISLQVGRDSSFVLRNASLGMAGNYTCRVMNDCGEADKSVVVVVKERLKIVSRGQEYQTVCANDEVKLNVEVNIDPVTFVWDGPDRKGWKEYREPFRSSYRNPSVQAGVDNGVYTCQIGDVCGSQSLSFNVEVGKKLKASQVVKEFTVCQGEDVTLRAVAEGKNVTYRWTKDGSVLNDFAETRIMKGVSLTDAGQYICLIHSDCGDTALIYRVNVKETTRVIAHSPDHKYVSELEKGTLFVTAIGENNQYKWKQDGVVVGDNSSVLNLPSFAGKPEGDYQFTCEVVGDCGKDMVTMNVYLRKLTYVTKDTTIAVCRNSDYIFKVNPLLSDCPTIQNTTYWVEYNGKIYSEGEAMQFPAGTKGGVYVWHVENQCESLVVNMNVLINDEPKLDRIVCEGALEESNDTLTICEGSDVRLIAQAAWGNMFKWTKQGVSIQEGTDFRFVLHNVSQEMAGRYSCRVINDCGEAVKEVTLVVRKKLRIVANSQENQATCNGSVVKLSVEVNVDDAVFTWDGPSKTNWTESSKGYISFYQNPSVQGETDNGVYSCHIENACGVEDISFNVDVEKTLVVLEVSPSDTVCEGNSVVVFARVNVPSVVCTWTLPDGGKYIGNTLEIPSVSKANAGLYRYHIESRCVADMNGEIDVAVFPELGVLQLSGDTAVCENQPIDIVSDIQGARLEYSWRGPGGLVSNLKSVEISAFGKQNVGIYELTVKDVCGKKQFGSTRLSILEDLKNLKISQDTIVCEGGQASLEVSHDGVAEYEWWFKQAKVSEARRLVVSAVSAQDTGMYICRVKGNCHTEERQVHVGLFRNLDVTSTDAVVRVCPGENVDLKVEATGERMQYIWTKLSSEVGYRENTYHINDVVGADAGVYKCDINSMCGSKSVVYELQVKERTQIVGHSSDRFVSEHDSVRLIVRTEGENNRFEWQQDGNVLSEKNSFLEIKDIGRVDTLNFNIVVRGECGEDSARIVVKIGPYKPLKETLSPDTLCEGSNYTYVANLIPPACYGDESFSYEWRKDGTLLPVSGSLLRVEDVKLKDGGEYSCRVFCDTCGEATMDWVIRVVETPAILSMTGDAFLTEGESHRIEVVAKGEWLDYFWQKDGVPYGKKQSVIDFQPVRYENQGTYRVTVSNMCSSQARESRLKVWQKTVIITPREQEIEACAGTDTLVRVEALGTSGLIYKWYRNNVLLSVPMTSELSLKSMKVEDSGIYKCIASGRGGEDSCFIHLNVSPLPNVEIGGNFGICANDLSQRYEVQTQDEHLLYKWESQGGTLMGRMDLAWTQVVWNGKDQGVIALNARSSETGCSVKKSKTIEYYPLPEVILDLLDTVGYCIDSLALEQGYPHGGYYWVNGIPEDVVRFTDKTIPYIVNYLYVDRCALAVSDTINVGVEPYVKVAEKQVVTGWCRPAELGIVAYTPGSIEWIGDGALDITDVLHPKYVAPEYSPEDLKFKVKLKDKYGCEVSDNVTVSLLPSPQVDLGRDTVVGVCQDVVLQANYTTDHFGHMEWSPANKLQIIDDKQAQVKDKQEGVNTYVATVVDLFGCRGSDTLLVEVAGAPKGEHHEFCATDTMVVDCSVYASYEWEDGYQGNIRVLKEAGLYTLKVTDQFGCEGENSYWVHAMPQVSLLDTFIFEGQTMEYRLELAVEYEPYRIRWQDGSMRDVLVADKEGGYTVSVSDNIGCSAQDSAYLTVRKRYIAAPDAFLPGTSAENARFYLKEVNFVNRFEMFIYDRWGELVYKTNEIGFKGGWNGLFKGMDCQAGIYIWVAFSDGKEIGRGTVALVR